MSEKLSTTSHDEKAALKALDIEAQPSHQTNSCSCSCAQKAVKASRSTRVNAITGLVMWIVLLAMCVMLVAFHVVVTAMPEIPFNEFDLSNPEHRQDMYFFMATAVPCNIMAYYAARGVLYACSVTQVEPYFTPKIVRSVKRCFGR